MKTQWLKVVIASVFEVGWVIGLTHAAEWYQWIPTLLAIFLSFYLMINAGKYLPVGTVYAVFVGLGAFGTVLSEIILFDAPFVPLKILLIFLILVGVVGLKMVTDDKSEEVS
ncbi:QacE family quaternary ammonium compound efflux SMR transporter [Salinicoccus cyprini]|uniref:QacE family quaternary ammonium compound efflux SMR transporter n=1 Tax=Salinicoccus cyprini TaxID=2493691 RepID=A0A558AV81_9STAP|nr:SMR family transporter [Salinicoccus cyprini]TVT28159.1 QacE family quaternary ammonium compound efflux SMR transporter [Salinicoccus cyprini]